MYIYGITGPSGSGKSILCEYFSLHGIPHINADALYHEMLVPPSAVVDALHSAFGDAIMNEEGGIDRRALSAIVFHSPEKLDTLNKVVLPLVLCEMRRRISLLKTEGVSAVAIDAPTLIESGFHTECDTVIAVLSSKAKRIERIIARDNISEERAKARIEAQKPDSFYTDAADVVLQNDGNREALFSQAASLIPKADERSETT